MFPRNPEVTAPLRVLRILLYGFWEQSTVSSWPLCSLRANRSGSLHIQTVSNIARKQGDCWFDHRWSLEQACSGHSRINYTAESQLGFHSRTPKNATTSFPCLSLSIKEWLSLLIPVLHWKLSSVISLGISLSWEDQCKD